ncbi:hypothetical protein BCR42DRAFT_496736 [Absidia repens]|uniref:RRM domain-containing protein n=1 Tax=Absidia repens TaxID=90262 RepID=A0A1X2HYT8_9FUNG|nr:hypothetical protein BCR42DRAFT_496736 [Absidia repens]
MQQGQQQLPSNMKWQKGKEWASASYSSTRIGVCKSSVTGRSPSNAAVMSSNTENNILVMNESESSNKNDWNELNGPTLVPNSPVKPFATQDLDDQLKSDYGVVTNDVNNQKDNEIDKRGNPLACVFVASLNKNIAVKELILSLHKHFEQWGTIISVKVSKDSMNRPYAFIQYERICDARQAVIQAYGSLLEGRAVRCEAARVNRTLHLSSLQFPLVEKDILQQLSKFGEVEDIHFVHDQGIPSAYVKFCYRNDAVDAYMCLKPPYTLGPWTVEWAPNVICSGEDTMYYKSCVFIGNLNHSVSKSDLTEKFGRYGIINSSFVRKRMNNLHSSTFGIVYYATCEAATQAISAENGQDWLGRRMRVSYREKKKEASHLKWQDDSQQTIKGSSTSYPFSSCPNPPLPSPDPVFSGYISTFDSGISSLQLCKAHYNQHLSSTTPTSAIQHDDSAQQVCQNEVSFESTPLRSEAITKPLSTTAATELPATPLPSEKILDESENNYDPEPYSTTNKVNSLQEQSQRFSPMAYNSDHRYDSNCTVAYNDYYYGQWPGYFNVMVSNQQGAFYYPFGYYYYYGHSTDNFPQTYHYPSQTACDMNSSYCQMYPHADSHYFASIPGPVGRVVPWMASPNPTHPSNTPSSAMAISTCHPSAEKPGPSPHEIIK